MSFFKHLQLYTFEKEFDFSASTFEKALDKVPFLPCPALMPMSQGFHSIISPSDPDAPKLYPIGGAYLFGLKLEEKIIPSNVTAQLLAQKIDAFEKEEARKISAKEKMRLKEDVISSLMPRAFTQQKHIEAYINPKQKILAINTSSLQKAEDFLSFLRKTLGSLPVKRVNADKLAATMTRWVKSKKFPAHFVSDSQGLLVDSREVFHRIRLTQHELLSGDLDNFLNAGMEFQALALQWRAQLGFTLKADGSLAQIKFLEVLKDTLDEIHTENAAAAVDAMYYLMVETFSALLDELLPLYA